MDIFVIPPFWQTPSFILSMIFLIISLIHILVKSKEERIIKQKEILEGIVKERTLALRNQNLELQNYIESNNRLEQFAQAASHDLKTPIRTISSYSGLLRKKVIHKLETSELKYLNHIETSAKKLHHMINDLLEYSKMNTTKINIEKIDCIDFISEIKFSLESIIRSNKADVKFDWNCPHFYGDKLKISRVLENLISNAVKFVSPKIKPKVIVHIELQEDNVQISVSDNGIGIAEENLDNIFNIFSRIHTEQEIEGTGIGLALCKQIIDTHDGKIWAESSLGMGSTFIFLIPQMEYAKQNSKKIALN